MNKKPEAVLIVSFGGPEGPADVMPFLDNVLRGKDVSEARKNQVAQHYEMFSGVSPINAQNRELKKLLQAELRSRKITIPIFWGNRNWKPYIKDALLDMKRHGVKHALAYVTSAYGSYSGCRRYREDVENARTEIGEGAAEVEKLRLFYNHPNFIKANVLHIQEEIKKIPAQHHGEVHLVFTAHSIPISMSETSPYISQLNEMCSSVARQLNVKNWKLVFQSRSGKPGTPWLEPDVCDHLQSLSDQGVKDVVVSPIGFVFDHMEVIYDLDVEAAKKAKKLGLIFHRAKSAGNHPLMIEMAADLVQERINGKPPFVCAPDCCKPRQR